MLTRLLLTANWCCSRSIYEHVCQIVRFTCPYVSPYPMLTLCPFSDGSCFKSFNSVEYEPPVKPWVSTYLDTGVSGTRITTKSNKSLPIDHSQSMEVHVCIKTVSTYASTRGDSVEKKTLCSGRPLASFCEGKSGMGGGIN